MRRAVLSYTLVTALIATAAGTAGYALGSPSPTRSPAAGTLLDEIPKRGLLRVCTTGDYEPFTHRDPRTGAYQGIDIEMSGLLAKSLGVRPRYVPAKWATLIPDLAAGRCDIAVGGVSVTPERARKVYFSTPYLTDGKAPIVRCDDKEKYRSLKDIDRKGVRVVVNPGGTNEQFARANIKAASLRVHTDNTTIFNEIADDRADVMMTDASETRFQSARNPELCAIRPDKPFTFSEKAYALPRGDDPFKGYVDQWLHLALNDGTYRHQADTWMKPE